jgi:hypothetical protein
MEKFIKILKLNQLNLDDDNNVIDILEDNMVKLNGYSFLVKSLETYNNKQYKNNEFVTAFLKCNLPTNYNNAEEQWFNGIKYDGYEYFSWFATTGGMKQEDHGICDTIFVREDYVDWALLMEDLISLGKFKKLENEEICINKDVLSRISLTTSDLITEISMPNIIVLPQATYHIVKDYKTVKKSIEKVKDNKGKEKNKVNYDLVDYSFNNDIDVFDGGGIGTPEVFNKIGETLNRKDIEFAIIRGYGIGVKGLITKFDIIKYLDYVYKQDTEYCRKNKNGNYELLDYWKRWREITDNTILLNESMVKLAKYFKDIEEYETLLNKLNNNTFIKYYNLLNKLYITKVNKLDVKITDYRRSNYQLINGLALTKKDLMDLTEQDFKVFNKILRPYDFIEGGENTNLKFIENIDYISLFSQQCVNAKNEDETYEEEIREKAENIANKTNELLNINPEYVKLSYVKKQLAYLIKKKCRELASGKFTIKAKYQYIAIDPISYMNYAMFREQKDNGLKENEFYTYDCSNEDIRTIIRNPCAAYSEIHNVKFVRNTFFDNYLSHCRELIYFNQKSDILALMSGADCDGDACTVINEPIIQRAVVTPKDGKYFISEDDGHKEKMKYNLENRFIATYKAAGNLIGSIALRACNVNSNAQKIPTHYISKKDEFVYYLNLCKENEKKFENIEDHKKRDKQQKDYVDALIKDKVTTGEFIAIGSNNKDEDLENKLREHIKQKFYDNEKDTYIILYNALKAIDAPKTLYFPTKADMEVINSKYLKKVSFLKYKENKEDVEYREYYKAGSTLLDKYSKEVVQKYLLDRIEDTKSDYRDNAFILQKDLKNDDYCKEIYNICFKEVETLYTNYNVERAEIRKKYSSAKRKLKKEINEDQETGNWDKWIEEDYKIKEQKLVADKRDDYKKLDIKYIPEANKIIKIFDLPTVCQSISQLKNCTENFILSLFWPCIEYLQAHLNNTRYMYIEYTGAENENVEDYNIEYLHRIYKKLEINNFDNSKIVHNIDIEDKLRLKMNKEIRFRLIDKSIVEEIRDIIDEGNTYVLPIKDSRLEIFEEFKEFIQDKEIINIVKINKVNVKSIGLICEV